VAVVASSPTDRDAAGNDQVDRLHRFGVNRNPDLGGAADHRSVVEVLDPVGIPAGGNTRLWTAKTADSGGNERAGRSIQPGRR
jgi:hypothetical protein